MINNEYLLVNVEPFLLKVLNEEIAELRSTSLLTLGTATILLKNRVMFFEDIPDSRAERFQLKGIGIDRVKEIDRFLEILHEYTVHLEPAVCNSPLGGLSDANR